jgi:hypothetical protein
VLAAGETPSSGGLFEKEMPMAAKKSKANNGSGKT